MPLRDHTIAFDLDGTLVDTAPDLVRALNVCMQDTGFPPTSIAQVRNMIGQGAKALILQAYNFADAVPTANELEQRLTHFLQDYAAKIADESRIFDGVAATLKTLSDTGARLTVCTNKPEALAIKLLEALDLAHYFDSIICPENVSAHKPDPAHVLKAIQPSSPKQAILVGDSAADLNAARAAQVPVILMSYGYSIIPAAELGADMVLDNFCQIPAAISTLLNIESG